MKFSSCWCIRRECFYLKLKAQHLNTNNELVRSSLHYVKCGFFCIKWKASVHSFMHKAWSVYAAIKYTIRVCRFTQIFTRLYTVENINVGSHICYKMCQNTIYLHILLVLQYTIPRVVCISKHSINVKQVPQAIFIMLMKFLGCFQQHQQKTWLDLADLCKLGDDWTIKQRM